MTAWEIMDEDAQGLGMWDAETNWRKGGQDFHLGFETSHFLDGFAWPDKKFRFKPDWAAFGPRGKEMPSLPDHFDVIDNATDDKPFRLVAGAGAHLPELDLHRDPSSLKREVRPTAMMNPEDCSAMASPRAIGSRSATSAARPSSCQGQERPAARRGGRRGHLAEPELRDRHRHQCRDLGRSRLAQRRRGVPRHGRLDQEGVEAPTRPTLRTEGYPHGQADLRKSRAHQGLFHT
jgi:hypothetical protein